MSVCFSIITSISNGTFIVPLCENGEIGKHKRLKISRLYRLEGSIPSSRINLIVVGLEASILNECGELPLAFPDYIIPQDEKRIKATSSSDVHVASRLSAKCKFSE